MNEAYLRLAAIDQMRFRDRTHIFAVAVTLMRGSSSITRASEKRGGGVSVASLDDQQIAATSDVDILALDEALDHLAAMDAQQSQIVELRFSGGLTIEETAEALGISPATVKREWTSAKAWLYHQLART